MTQNRFYSSVAAKTTLTGTVNSSVTTLLVASATGFPASLPFTLILERDTANEEVVTVTAVSGTTLTVSRAQDGTTGVTHNTGATVEHGVSARDFNEPQAHIAATTGVHGLTSAPVGTTDTQTLTNKTLTAPVIADHTNATHSHGNAAGGGTLLQANTHGSADTDASTSSLHHTIGTGAAQAAAGNHGHSGVYQPAGSYAASSHGHAESDVTSLISDLAGKAAASHSHAESDVTSLVSDLAGKAASGHTHAYSALTSRPLNVIAGGQATLSFSSGAATLAHGLGTTPTSVAVTSVSGGGTNVVVMLSGPTSSDGTNIYLRATNVNASTNFTGSATFTWIAFA